MKIPWFFEWAPCGKPHSSTVPNRAEELAIRLSRPKEDLSKDFVEYDGGVTRGGVG